MCTARWQASELWPQRTWPNQPTTPHCTRYRNTNVVGNAVQGQPKQNAGQVLYLFEFVGDQVDAQWEVFDTGEFVAQFENSQLWVWDTTVEPGFRVRLVLAVPVASCWTATHGELNAPRQGRGHKGKQGQPTDTLVQEDGAATLHPETPPPYPTTRSSTECVLRAASFYAATARLAGRAAHSCNQPTPAHCSSCCQPCAAAS